MANLYSKPTFPINSGSKFEKDFGIDYTQYINAVVKERDEKYRKRISGMVVEKPSPVLVTEEKDETDTWLELTESAVPEVYKPKVTNDGFDEELFYRVIDLVQQNRPNNNDAWTIHNLSEKRIIKNEEYHAVYQITKSYNKRFEITIGYAWKPDVSSLGINKITHYIQYEYRPDEYNLLLGCLEYWKNQQIIENKKEELKLRYAVDFWTNLKLKILKFIKAIIVRMKDE